jgi:hypothetical protein
MPPQNTTQATAPLPVPMKMGKFKASRAIVKQSWAVLNQNKQMYWYPIVSAIISLTALLVMIGIAYFGYLNGSFDNYDALSANKKDFVSYGVALVYYLVMFFILNFFQSGVLLSVDSLSKGERITFGEGVRRASAHIGKLFVWSLISATVGVVLNAISERSKILGKIVTSLLGVAWAIMTYFSLPALVLGGVSIRGSFKESADLIRKTWGEAFIVNIGVGFFFGILVLIAFFLGLGIFVLMPSTATFIAIVVFFILFVLVISVISSVLSVIFKYALYQYAKTGVVPAGFSAEILNRAVKK